MPAAAPCFAMEIGKLLYVVFVYVLALECAIVAAPLTAAAMLRFGLAVPALAAVARVCTKDIEPDFIAAWNTVVGRASWIVAPGLRPLEVVASNLLAALERVVPPTCVELLCGCVV